MVLWEKVAGFGFEFESSSTGKILILEEFQDFLDLNIYGLLRMLTNCIGISGFFRKISLFLQWVVSDKNNKMKIIHSAFLYQHEHYVCHIAKENSN
jgi:hypothetical protein